MSDHVCFDHVDNERCTICGSTVITTAGKSLKDAPPALLHANTIPRWKMFLVTIIPPLARWLLPEYVFLSWWRRALIRRSLRWQVAGFTRSAKVSWRIARAGADEETHQALCGYAGRLLIIGG